MVAIWPQTGFRSAREVIDAFVAAYPHAPDDPHLDQLVIEIASRAVGMLPWHDRHFKFRDERDNLPSAHPPS